MTATSAMLPFMSTGRAESGGQDPDRTRDAIRKVTGEQKG
jgi:hypothetical protein